MAEVNKMKILLIRPMEVPKEMEIEDSLEEMQRLVGGYIQEIMPFDDDVALVCNEEGKFMGLPLNRAIQDERGKVVDIIAGDFFLCRAPVESENFESLTKEQVEKYKKRFHNPERFLKAGNEIVVIPIRSKREEMER